MKCTTNGKLHGQRKKLAIDPTILAGKSIKMVVRCVVVCVHFKYQHPSPILFIKCCTQTNWIVNQAALWVVAKLKVGDDAWNTEAQYTWEIVHANGWKCLFITVNVICVVFSSDGERVHCLQMQKLCAHCSLLVRWVKIVFVTFSFPFLVNGNYTQTNDEVLNLSINVA